MSDLYNIPQYPVMIVVSGPSGAGKDTVARSAIAKRPSSFYFVVTATNRPAREGEVEGVDYFFVTTAEFERMIAQNELLEHAEVYGSYKGIPKKQIRDALVSGRNVIMRIDVQGAATLRKLVPDAIFVFIGAESEESLEQRLSGRETETPEQFATRMQTARDEMAQVPEFDYYIKNQAGQSELAVAQLLAIVDAERLKIGRSPIQL